MAMTKKERARLEAAEMSAKEAQEIIDVLFGNKSTNTFMSQWGMTIQEYPLLPNAIIRFQIGGHGHFIQAGIVLNGTLEIMGDNAIEISPKAANTIEIKMRA